MNRRRHERTPTAASAPDEADAASQAEPHAAQHDHTAPSDLADAAESLRRDAELARAAATRYRDEAHDIAATATAEIAKLTTEADFRCGELKNEAGRREREASGADERALWLSNAAAQQARADEADDRVDGLDEERKRLTGQIADLDCRLAGLENDREATDGQLTAARQAGDVAAITTLLGRIAGIGDLKASLAAQQATAQDRLQAIGDGEGPGELTDARRLAAGLHAAVRGALNAVYPDRPEAVRDRDAASSAAVLEHWRRRAQDAASQPATARRIVML